MKELLKKYKFIFICLLVLTLYLFFLWYPLFDPNARLKMFITYDFAVGFPQVIYFFDNLSLAKLSTAHWNQYVAGGTPALLDYSNYYFPSYILKFLFELKHNFISLIDWQNFVFVHLIVAGLGMYLFLRKKISGHMPALFGAIFFVTSGLMHKIDWPMYIFAFTLIPWVFYLLEIYGSSKKIYWLFLAAFLLFQQLAACAQIFMYTAITIFGYVLILGENSWKPKIKQLAILFSLAFLYSAVFLLPLLEFSRFAVRQNYLSYDVIDTLSTKAADIFQLLVYAPGWQYTYLYIGGVSIFLIVNLFVNQRKLEYFKLLGIAIFIFLLSTNTSLFASILRFTPGLGDLKQHSRASELVIFLLLMIIAEGIKYLKIDYKRDIKILSGLAAFSILIYYLRIERTTVSLEQLSFTLLCLGLAAMTLYAYNIGVIKIKIVTILIGIIVVFDMARVHMLLEKTVLANYTVDKLNNIVKDPFVFMARPNSSEVGDTGYRFPYKYKNSAAGFDANAFIVKKQYSDGYYGAPGSTLTPYTLASFDLYMKAADLNPNLKKLANINAGDGFLPRAFTVSCYKVEENDLKLLDIMSDKGFTGDSFVYLSKKPEEITAVELKDGEKCQSALKPIDANQQKDKITFSNLNLEKPAILFISDNYYPGWNAYVDGQKVDVIRADYTFKAVPLTAGVHNVEFKYESISYKIGGFISWFSIAFSLLYVLIKFRFKQKNKKIN